MLISPNFWKSRLRASSSWLTSAPLHSTWLPTAAPREKDIHFITVSSELHPAAFASIGHFGIRLLRVRITACTVLVQYQTLPTDTVRQPSSLALVDRLLIPDRHAMCARWRQHDIATDTGTVARSTPAQNNARSTSPSLATGHVGTLRHPGSPAVGPPLANASEIETALHKRRALLY